MVKEDVMVLVNKEAWWFHGGVVDGHERVNWS
jgi:hypothetical protein